MSDTTRPKCSQCLGIGKFWVRGVGIVCWRCNGIGFEPVGLRVPALPNRATCPTCGGCGTVPVQVKGTEVKGAEDIVVTYGAYEDPI